MKIGILTGGGDAPGINGVIRAATIAALREGYEVVGIRNGWKGLIELDTMPLTEETVREISTQGGTILGTSRTNPAKIERGYEKIIENAKKLKLDALIAIGGEDTQSVAFKVNQMGLPVVGVPKTIDNDVVGTDYTFGFDTAVNICMEAIDRLRTTAKSHSRVIIVEVMGRHSGWIALHAGIAGEADMILIPEVEYSLEDICEKIKNIRKKKNYAIIVVSEGVKVRGLEVIEAKERDAFGHIRLGGVGKFLERAIKEKTGYETRSVILGHLQRGGPPSAFDRYLTARFGIKAVELIKSGKTGRMVALRGTEIIDVPLNEVANKTRTVPKELYEKFNVLFT